jgi:hypothetical protein
LVSEVNRIRVIVIEIDDDLPVTSEVVPEVLDPERCTHRRLTERLGQQLHETTALDP